MNSAVLTFDSSGIGAGLYTELIDLHQIGALEITRASNIEFNNETQEWEVKALSGQVLFTNQSRLRCLNWEMTNIAR
jgi:hypothetical protein